MDTTTIEVSVETWRWLNSQKRPGESFDDVLTRLREEQDDHVTVSTETDDEQTKASLPDDLDLPGSGEVLDRRRETITQLYAHLQHEGTASKADFLDLVDPDTVGYASAESFWSNAIKGRESLSALPGVEPPGEGGHTWRYTGQ